jgi:hypothetical protein
MRFFSFSALIHIVIIKHTKRCLLSQSLNHTLSSFISLRYSLWAISNLYFFVTPALQGNEPVIDFLIEHIARVQQLMGAMATNWLIVSKSFSDLLSQCQVRINQLLTLLHYFKLA